MGFFDKLFDFVFGWMVPDQPKPETGITVSKPATDAYIPKIYGSVGRHTGTIVFKETNDADSDDVKNDLMHVVIVWGEAVHSIDNVYLDDVNINDAIFDAGGGSRWANARHFPNGMQGYSDPILTTAGWSNSDKWTGKACSYLRFERDPDSDAFSGEPSVTADITGTVSQNPIVHLKDYLKSPVYGKGLTDDDLDLVAFATEEAVCDLQVETFVGSAVYRPLFTCNAELKTSNTVFDNVEALLKACRAGMPLLDGKFTPIIEKDDPAVDFTIDETNIISLGPIEESSKSNKYNQVSVKFKDASANWTTQEAIYPETNSAEHLQYLAEDNGVELDKTFNLDTCNNYDEALDRAQSLVAVSRNQLRTTIEMGPEASILQVGDIVPVTHSFPGWVAKKFRIEKTDEDTETGIITLDVREHQPAISSIPNEVTRPAIPDTTLSFSAPSTPTGLAITAHYDNFKQVTVSWVSTAPRFDIQVKDASDNIVIAQTVSRNDFDLNNLPLGTYEFYVRARGGLGRVSGFAGITVVMQVPGIPTIAVNASNFELEIIPTLTGADSSVQFDFAIGNTTNPRGPAATYTFGGLTPDTEYTIYVRSNNKLGQSGWASQTVSTTNDATVLVDFIGNDVAGAVFDDVVTAVQGDLQTVVDASLGSYSDTTQTQTLIDDSISEVNNAVGEDFRIGRVGEIVSIFADYQNKKEIRTETTERETQYNVVQAEVDQNQAQVFNLEESFADEQTATALSLTQLTTRIEDEEIVRAGQYTEVVNLVADEESARITKIEELRTDITGPGGNIDASITSYNSTLVSPTGAIATSINGLRTEISGTNGTIDSRISSEITDYNQSLVSPAGAIATQVSASRAAMEGPGGSVFAAAETASQAQSDADGNADAIQGIKTAVAGEGNESQAEIILTSTVSNANEAYSRAFFGVTSTAGGISTVNGIVIDGATNSIAFQSNAFMLRNTAGQLQLYWDNPLNIWKFAGELSAASGTFSGSLSAASGTFTGTVAGGTIVGSRFTTSDSTIQRVEIEDDGTYLIWAGSGSKNDTNADFFIKKNGTGFVSGEFFQGEIIESKSGSASGPNATTATAFSHSSAGKPVKVDAAANFDAQLIGDFQGQAFELTGTVTRGGIVVGTISGSGIAPFYDSLNNATRIRVSLGGFVLDNPTAGTYNYTLSVALSGPTYGATTQTYNLSIITTENKLS